MEVNNGAEQQLKLFWAVGLEPRRGQLRCFDGQSRTPCRVYCAPSLALAMAARPSVFSQWRRAPSSVRALRRSTPAALPVVGEFQSESAAPLHKP